MLKPSLNRDLIVERFREPPLKVKSRARNINPAMNRILIRLRIHHRVGLQARADPKRKFAVLGLPAEASPLGVIAGFQGDLAEMTVADYLRFLGPPHSAGAVGDVVRLFLFIELRFRLRLLDRVDFLLERFVLLFQGFEFFGELKIQFLGLAKPYQDRRSGGIGDVLTDRRIEYECVGDPDCPD